MWIPNQRDEQHAVGQFFGKHPVNEPFRLAAYILLASLLCVGGCSCRREREQVTLPPVVESSEAVDPALETARRARLHEGKKRLAELSQAMMNHELATGVLLPVLSPTPGPNRLLSWRVHLLPYLQEQDLYRAFHLDEPWDSEHNQTLMGRMPEVYATAGGQADGTTSVMVFKGAGAPFAGGGSRLDEFRDDRYKTMVIVQAGPDKAVPWTKPEDLTFSTSSPRDALGDISAEGFLAVFADGHVQLLPADISSDNLTAMITHAGGEAVKLPNPN